MPYLPSKKSLKQRKVSKETKEVLNSIIADLSVLIRRKSSSTPLPFENITAAMKTMETKIAAVSIGLPEIATCWEETKAREAFHKITRRRKRTINSLIVVFSSLSFLLLAGSVAAIILLDHWSKYLLLLTVVLLLIVVSSNFKKIILQPLTRRQESTLQAHFSEECKILNEFIDYLNALRRRL